jgi:hypothetical protein
VPPNQTSVLGLARSAISCASASPEPLSDMLTLMPVVLGEHRLDHVAPLGLHRADDVDLAPEHVLGLRRRKAIVVVRGGDITIENLEFRGARADDANGAGIRHETGKLTVRNCLFLDNENGILTGNDANAELVVEDSEFGLAPRVEGGLHHLLYVGRIGRFSIRGSRFYSGHEGHLIKSRARENRITYNLIYDGDEGQASYEIDLPNAGLAWIIGNVIGQGPNGQNPVMVAYGSEQRPGRRTVCTSRTTASSATPGRRRGTCVCSTTGCRRTPRSRSSTTSAWAWGFSARAPMATSAATAGPCGAGRCRASTRWTSGSPMHRAGATRPSRQGKVAVNRCCPRPSSSCHAAPRR